MLLQTCCHLNIDKKIIFKGEIARRIEAKELQRCLIVSYKEPKYTFCIINYTQQKAVVAS